MRTLTFYRNAATFSWILPLIVFLLRILEGGHELFTQETVAGVGVLLGGTAIALAVLALRKVREEGDAVIMPAGIGLLLSGWILITSVLVLIT